MGEAVAVGAGLLDKSRPHRLVQGVKQAVLWGITQRGQQLDVEVAAEHGRHRQHLVGLGRQASETPPDHVAHPLGHCHGGVAGDHPVVVLAAHHPGLDQVAEHLPDEERIALGLGMQALRQAPGVIVEFLARRLGHQLGHLGHRQTGHGELLDARQAPHISHHPGQGMAAAKLGVAVGAQHQQTHAVAFGHRRPQHMPQQQQHRFGRPVQVVEHQHHRLLAAQLDQPGPGCLEEEIFLRARIRRHRRRQPGQPRPEQRLETGQLTRVPAQDRWSTWAVYQSSASANG